VINGHFTVVPNAGGSWSDPAQYNTSFDVFSYTAAPLFVPQGQTVTLVPDDGSNVPPHTHHGTKHPPKRSRRSEEKVQAKAAHAARTAHKVQGHRK
jgi:hypothetical protein